MLIEAPSGLSLVQVSRTAVNTAGYDSDSSDDGEGVVLSRKPGAKGDGDDSDDDMFADPSTKQVNPAAAVGGGKKKEKFLALGDIEGQEFGAGGSDDDEDDADKEAGGLDGSMGFELSSFNMKDELNEGKFTEDGSYVAKDKDAMEVHDKWLEGLESKASMRKAREAKKKQDQAEEERAQREMDDLQSGRGREEKVAEMVELLQRGETVMQAMQRLGGKSGGEPKKSWADRLKEKKKLAKAAKASGASSTTAADDVDMVADSAPRAGSSSTEPSSTTSSTNHSSKTTSSDFDRLSALTSDLTSLGQLDIYTMSREALQRLLPPPPPAPTTQAGASRPPPPDDGATYEYRFKMDYIKSLPEGERPVEREIFGASNRSCPCFNRLSTADHTSKSPSPL